MLPRALKSFEAIDKVLTTKRDWKAQERAYRADAQAPPAAADPDVPEAAGRPARWPRRDLSLAPQAVPVSTPVRSRSRSQIDPENAMRADGTDRAEILAELYLVAGPDYTDKAVAAAHADAAQASRSSTTRTRRCARSTWTATSTIRPGASVTRSPSSRRRTRTSCSSSSSTSRAAS